MKFQVARRDLDVALALTSPAMSSGGNDISAHYVFRPHPKDSGKMEVLTYTSRICASAPFIVKKDDNDNRSFTIEGKRLKSWVAVLPDDAVLVFDNIKAEDVAKTTVTVLNDSYKKQHFASLDPATFPYTDQTLQDAHKTATIKAPRLKEAITCAQLFNAEDESKLPGLCVSEVRDGVLTSTNKATVCMISMPDLKASKIRIHTKAVSNLSSFLSLAKDEDVEIREHERRYFIMRGDGSYFGESRFHETFPVMGRPPATDQVSWKLNIEAVKRAKSGVTSGSADGDERIWLSRKGSDGPLMMFMDTSTGEQSSFDIPIQSTTEGATTAADGSTLQALPDRIQLTNANLERLLKAVDSDEIDLAANTYKKSGFFRYTETKYADTDKKNGDEYLMMLVWMANK